MVRPTEPSPDSTPSARVPPITEPDHPVPPRRPASRDDRPDPPRVKTDPPRV